MSRSKIAVFIDVENLTHWLKEKGPEKLVTELSSTGQLIVRKAYGNWNTPNSLSWPPVILTSHHCSEDCGKWAKR